MQPGVLGQLTQLRSLNLDDNLLNPELAAAYEEGLDAVMRYLRAKAEAQVVLNEAKLILVGEGEVGKSCLLGALRGDEWVEGRPTTHGIEIKTVEVKATTEKAAERLEVKVALDTGSRRLSVAVANPAAEKDSKRGVHVEYLELEGPADTRPASQRVLLACTPGKPRPEQTREILEIIKGRTERNAGRPLFEEVDYRKILPVMGGMSGADISEIIRRALETKVHRAAEGAEPGSVSTDDLLVSIDAYKRVRGVVEKIRYGQYL